MRVGRLKKECGEQFYSTIFLKIIQKVPLADFASDSQAGVKTLLCCDQNDNSVSVIASSIQIDHLILSEKRRTELCKFTRHCVVTDKYIAQQVLGWPASSLVNLYTKNQNQIHKIRKVKHWYYKFKNVIQKLRECPSVVITYGAWDRTLSAQEYSQKVPRGISTAISRHKRATASQRNSDLW